MHTQPKILQAEFAEIFACHCEWIEIVFLKISSKLPAPLFVFAPNESYGQKKCRHDDRRDDVDTKFVLQCIDHGPKISFAAIATSLRPVSCGKAVFLCITAHRAVVTAYFYRNFAPLITDF